MEPTELYSRSKRNLVIFSALLALALFGVVEVKTANNQYGVVVIPSAVPTILFFVVLYLLYQFFLADTFQRDEVRQRTRIDFAITIGFSSFVLVGYLGYYLLWQILGLSPTVLLSIISALIASVATAISLSKWTDLTKWRREVVDLRQQTLEQRLKQPGWVLNYNPKFPNRTKPISFEGDGSIGDGRNDNENRWSLDNNQLVMIRADGSEHNRFEYDAQTDRFISHRASSVHKITGQYIYRESA
jgi:hypothetical protein